MPVLSTTPAASNAVSNAAHCVGRRIQSRISVPRFPASLGAAKSSTKKAVFGAQHEEQAVPNEWYRGSSTSAISGIASPPVCIKCAPNPILRSELVSSPHPGTLLPSKRIIVKPFSTAVPSDENNGQLMATVDIMQKLETDTDAALQGNECNLLELLDYWEQLQVSLRHHLKRSEWSDSTNPKLQRVIRCAERVDALVRSYHDATLKEITGRSALGDELEPYRISMRVWSKTPTYYSGDRAAAVLELWGDKYGGFMTKQPTIEAFDLVLKAFALSSGVDTKEGNFIEEEGKLVEYPDDKAVSTLRLLYNLGDMYLAPTVTTVSHVIQALRRASRTSRGYNDGRNEERAKTAIALMQEIGADAAVLFQESSNDLNEEAKELQHRYIQACCDTLSMSVASLPINEAIEESSLYFDEIDKYAFGNASVLIPSLASIKCRNDQEMPQAIRVIKSTIRFTLNIYKDRATYDENVVGPAPDLGHNSAGHIFTIAEAAIDVITRARRWDGVIIPGDFVTFQQICSLAADPSIVHDESIDVARDVVPIIQAADEVFWEVKDDMPIMGALDNLMRSWATLSGHVRSAIGSDGHAASPVERLTEILKYKVEHNRKCRPEQKEDLTGAYNRTLQAWSRARAGKLGAAKGLQLLDEMRSDEVSATPNDFTYALILKCLRYTKSPKMAMKAEAIITEMLEGSVRPNARHYSAAIASIARSGHRNAAKVSKALLKRLLISYYETKDANLLPDHYMFCEVMNAIGRDKSDSLNKALKIQNLLRNLIDLHEETGHERLLPNEAVFNSAILAIANIRDDDNAVGVMEEIVDEMRSSSLRPDARLLTTLISFHGKYNPDAAEAVLREMEALYASSGKENFRPNNRSYKAAILAWARAGNANRCRALLDEMLEKYASGDEAVKPDSTTFAFVINSLWKSGDPNAPEAAIEMLQLLEDEFAKGDADFAPTTAVYTSVVNTLARSDLSDKAVRAKEVLERAKRRVRPDISLLTGVLSACAYTKSSIDDQRTAFAIAQEVEAELHDNPSLRWDSIVFSTLLQVYGYLVADQRERDKLSSRLFKQCCERGLVSKPLLGTLRRFSPSIYQNIGDKSLFAKGGHVKIGKLPPEWTRNARRKK